MKRILRKHDYDSVKPLPDSESILKVSVTEEKKLTSKEVSIHKYSFLYDTTFSATFFIKSVISLKLLSC